MEDAGWWALQILCGLRSLIEVVNLNKDMMVVILWKTKRNTFYWKVGNLKKLGLVGFFFCHEFKRDYKFCKKKKKTPNSYSFGKLAYIKNNVFFVKCLSFVTAAAVLSFSKMLDDFLLLGCC